MLITHLYVCIQIDLIFRVSFQKQKRQLMGLPWWLSGKESTCQCRRHGSIPELGRSHMPRSNQAHEGAQVPQLESRPHSKDRLGHLPPRWCCPSPMPSTSQCANSSCSVPPGGGSPPSLGRGQVSRFPGGHLACDPAG